MPRIIPNQLGENAAALIRRIWAASIFVDYRELEVGFLSSGSGGRAIRIGSQERCRQMPSSGAEEDAGVPFRGRCARVGDGGYLV